MGTYRSLARLSLTQKEAEALSGLVSLALAGELPDWWDARLVAAGQRAARKLRRADAAARARDLAKGR